MRTLPRLYGLLVPVALCVCLLAAPVRADLLDTDWSMTSQDVEAADADVVAVAEPFTNSADQVYRFSNPSAAPNMRSPRITSSGRAMICSMPSYSN